MKVKCFRFIIELNQHCLRLIPVFPDETVKFKKKLTEKHVKQFYTLLLVTKI